MKPYSGSHTELASIKKRLRVYYKFLLLNLSRRTPDADIFNIIYIITALSNITGIFHLSRQVSSLCFKLHKRLKLCII